MSATEHAIRTPLLGASGQAGGAGWREIAFRTAANSDISYGTGKDASLRQFVPLMIRPFHQLRGQKSGAADREDRGSWIVEHGPNPTDYPRASTNVGA